MSNLTGFTKSTKVKVFLGFGMVTIGLVVALYFAIISFRQISGSAKTLAQPNPRPVHLSQLLTSLAEAESHLRAYSLTKNDNYLKNYEVHTKDVYKQLNILKKLNQGESWEKRLDTLTTLINKKVTGLNEFTTLKNKMDQQGFGEKALKRLSQNADRPMPVNTTLKTTEREIKTKLPPAPQVQMRQVEKKGLLNKMFGKSKSAPVVTLPDSALITTTREVSIDTIVLAQPVADSLVRGMRKILRELQKEESSNRRQLSKQELALLAFDQVVMDQIRRVIFLMEKEEADVSHMRIIKAQRVVDNASLIIFLISCTGIVTSFIFVTMVIRDISRNNFYKSQLEKAKLKEEQLRQVKEQFLANMSHEIRTPLNAIIGFSEQLRQQELPTQQHKQVEAIRFSSDFLLATVNDILDISKIEAGQVSFEKFDFDLLPILLKTADLIENRASAKGLVFTPDLPLAPAYLKGDPFRLQQILYNLLGNAIKFTDSGEVKLKCRARDNGFGKYVVDITVSDSGIGIPTKKIAQIFDSFTQADPSITRRYGGTGLGLAITKKLIDLQGGEISVRSREGKGTIFYVSIPFGKGMPVEAEPVVQKLKVIPEAWQSKTILVVDDDPLNILLLQTILKKWKIPTITAFKGSEALEKLAEQNVDLILTDMNMPGMSGLELLEEVRKISGAKSQTPVVAVTANAMQHDLNYYLEKGMTAYLLKPFQERELMDLLAKFWHTSTDTTDNAEGTVLSSETPLPPALHELPKGQKAPSATQPDGKPNKIAANTPLRTALAAVTPSSAYSLHIYHKYSAGDPDALRLMLETFLSNTEDNLKLMKQICLEQNWAELKELSHKMYPSFKQIEAEKAALLLRKMELQADATAAQRTQWVGEFLEEAQMVVAFVRAEFDETVGAS